MLSTLGRIGHFTTPFGLLNLTLYNEKICEDMRVGKNKDILLLIILLRCMAFHILGIGVPSVSSIAWDPALPVRITT